LSKANRRTFLKNVGQGTLAAGLGLGLPAGAMAGTPDATGKANDSVVWPYPVQYGKETEVDVDVLVIGGGMAGCWAAIGAARKGAKVALVEKGSTIHSGSAGAGIDHWQWAATNPASRVAPEVLAQEMIDARKGYICGITRFIKTHEGWDRLLELEQMGMKIRDDEDEFKGVPFRDEKTKLLFAYDYHDNTVIRIWGTTMKPVLTKECRRLGVKIFDRVMGTSLLSQNGRQGSRIVGATGVNVRTGEFLIFKAKATILATAGASRIWHFIDNNLGTIDGRPPVVSGDAFAMAWKAGAMFTLMEATSGAGRGMGLGMTAPTSSATWYPASQVDANGKEIPWVDCFGSPVTTVSQRCYAAPGQKRMLGGGAIGGGPEYSTPHPLSGKELEEEVKKGNYVLPLYVDLTSMPEYERKAIFGMMVGQEGLTWLGYRNWTKAGFDPNKDLPQVYERPGSITNVRSTPINAGGLVIDWDLRSNLEGLYAAGESAFSTWGAAGGATSGHWAGKKAAEYALRADKAPIDRQQIAREKERVFEPARIAAGLYWKELKNGIAKIMQDYCGDVKCESKLKIGARWLKDLNDNEARKLQARNPHELMRAMEALNTVTVSQMIINASLARKASNSILGFQRSDYPMVNPPEWNKFITLRLEQDAVKIGELPIDYGSPLAENYARYSK
jgi:succinate dehydrogenase/fumarate reductase flavoprotein subunit